jgi:nucleoside-diphosphate-sugar epimerase
MKYLVTGAGQIGRQLVADLSAEGHDVVVLRRGDGAVPGARTVSGDAADRELLRTAAAGASAVFHCVHTSYDAAAWERDLPGRERAVMDAAAELGIPVVFPESVYAFGEGARDLSEDAAWEPASPLGEVRRRLLAAREAHPARTLSVVAADLLGPTANPQTSVYKMMVLGPARRGRTAWVMGDPDASRSFTYIPDLSAAMVVAARRCEALAPGGSAVLMAPSGGPLSQRQMAADAARVSGRRRVRVRRIPRWVFTVGGILSPMMRELGRQSYLWRQPSVLRAGRLTDEYGMTPTPWDAVVREECGAPEVSCGAAEEPSGGDIGRWGSSGQAAREKGRPSP